MVVSTPMYHFAKYNSVNNSGEIIEYCYLDRTTTLCKAYVSTLISIILFAPTLILTFVYVGIIRNLQTINKRYSTPDLDLAASAAHRKHTATNFEIIFRSSQSAAAAAAAAAATESSIRIILLNRGRDSNGVNPKLAYEEIKRSFCTKNLIRKRRQTIILCTVTMTFFFCQIPIKIFQIFNTFYEWSASDDSQFKMLNIIFLTTKLIYCFHPMSNPIIYNLMSSKFSRSYRKVLLCKSLSGSYSMKEKQPNTKICFKPMSRNRASGIYDELKSNNSSLKRTSMGNGSSHNQQQRVPLRLSNAYD